MFDHEFDWEEDEETALLEETTGFALLEAEDEDNSEALRVLERQVSTLEVQLENLQDIEGEIEGLTARILELETQIDMLNGI